MEDIRKPVSGPVEVNKKKRKRTHKEVEIVPNKLLKTTDTRLETPPEDPHAADDEEQARDKVKYNEERAKLIFLIRAYQSKFAEITRDVLHGIELTELSKVDAEKLLYEIRQEVCCKNGLSIGEDIGGFVLEALEGFLLMLTPINCKGLSNLAKDPKFVGLMDEMSLEMINFTYTKPVFRAALLVGKTTWMLHKINTEADAHGMATVEERMALQNQFNQVVANNATTQRQ